MKKALLYTLFISTAGFAQDAKIDSLNIGSKSNDTTEKVKEGFNFNGYVDINYFHNLNRPQNGTNLGASGYERAFDQKADQFQIGLVQTKISYTHQKSEAVVDLVFGPHADLGNYGNVVGPLGATTSLAIKQAYFNWKATKKLVFTAGQFGTHVGYEVIDAPLNFHYSLNNLFNNGPFYHIGAKAAYSFTEKVTLMAGLVNNWDNLYDNNKYKTIISQLAFVANDKTKLFLNYVGGDETTMKDVNGNTLLKNDSLHGFKQLIDLVGNFQLTEKFYIGINGVLGQLGYNNNGLREKRNWGGAALYVNYAFTDKFTLGARADYLDNTQGVQYIGNTDVVSGTLTGIIKVADDHLHIKPEVRFDNYKKRSYIGPDTGNIQQFMDRNGNFTLSQQITVGMALVYKF